MPLPSEFSFADLEAWVQAFGLRLDHAMLSRLQAYIRLLLMWNRRMPLVSQTNAGEILCKHFADSLVAAAACPRGDRLVDLGSGAGFPGLPIAIVRPDVSVTMIDSNRKKVSFLHEALRLTNTSNGCVVDGRIEAVAQHPDHSGLYTLATARAVTTVDEFLTLARPFLHPGAWAIAMKGPTYEAELRTTDLKSIGFELTTVTSYCLPDGARRVLLFFHLA